MKLPPASDPVSRRSTPSMQLTSTGDMLTELSVVKISWKNNLICYLSRRVTQVISKKILMKIKSIHYSTIERSYITTPI